MYNSFSDKAIISASETISYSMEAMIDYSGACCIKDFATPIKSDKKTHVKNVGKSTGRPFCMTYLFTKSGLQIVCGSYDAIREETKTYQLCHGMSHYYTGGEVVMRRWDIFGRGGYEASLPLDPLYISLLYIRSGEESIPFFLEGFFDEKPKQSRFYIVLTDDRSSERKMDILASWRKLPSRYINEFDSIIEDYF